MKAAKNPKIFDFGLFGQALVDFRTRNNMSFSAVSDATGIDRKVLHRVETGLATGVNNILCLCWHMSTPFVSFLK